MLDDVIIYYCTLKNHILFHCNISAVFSFLFFLMFQVFYITLVITKKQKSTKEERNLHLSLGVKLQRSVFTGSGKLVTASVFDGGNQLHNWISSTVRSSNLCPVLFSHYSVSGRKEAL